jgi:hypothetical protein
MGWLSFRNFMVIPKKLSGYLNSGATSNPFFMTLALFPS